MDMDRWRRLDMKQQMGHVTSEIARARHWEERGDLQSRREALHRALALTDQMLLLHTKHRRRELARLREIMCHCLVQSDFYKITLQDLERYGMPFILAALT